MVSGLRARLDVLAGYMNLDPRSLILIISHPRFPSFLPSSDRPWWSSVEFFPLSTSCCQLLVTLFQQFILLLAVPNDTRTQSAALVQLLYYLRLVSPFLLHKPSLFKNKMLVLNTRLSLLASTLTVLAISSVSTTASAAAIGVRAKSDSAPPTSPGYDTSTQNPWHQDRPSDLGLPEGKEPDSVASRKGMGNGRAHTRSWTATWTGTWTSEWERPTGSDHPWHGGSLPLDSENPEDAQEETPSQDVEDPEETEELSRVSVHLSSCVHRVLTLGVTSTISAARMAVLVAIAAPPRGVL